MWIVASFTLNGAPATGLLPTAVIRDVDTGLAVVSGVSMDETGDGFYSYDFSAYNPLNDYTVICDSVTLSGVERYSYASTGEYNEVLDSIDSTMGVVDLRSLLLRKIQTNRLELLDGDSDNWVLYDDDGTTPLLTFDISDKDGNIIVQSPNAPSKRSTAEGTISGSYTPDIYMRKSVYDPDDDGFVSNAENVSDGVYTSTASGVKYAVDNSHLPCILGTKCINESNIGDKYVVKYDDATDRLVYGSGIDALIPVKKHVTIKAEEFKLGSPAPTQAVIGNFPVLQFPGATSSGIVYTSFHIPSDWQSGTGVDVRVNWAPTNASGGTVVWQMTYDAVAVEANEVISNIGTTISVSDDTQLLQDELLRSGDMTISGALLSSEDTIGVTIFRYSTHAADDYNFMASLVSVEFVYTSDNIGESI